MAGFRDWRSYYARFAVRFTGQFLRGKLELILALIAGLLTLLWGVLAASPLEDLRSVLPQLAVLASFFSLLAIYHVLRTPVILDLDERNAHDETLQTLKSLQSAVDRRGRPVVFATFELPSSRRDSKAPTTKHYVELANVGPAAAADIRLQPIKLINDIELTFAPVALCDARASQASLITVHQHGTPLTTGRHNLGMAIRQLHIGDVECALDISWIDGSARTSNPHVFRVSKGLVRIAPA